MEEYKDTSCGLFSWRPPGLQRFANHRFYLGLYSIVGVIMGIIYSYVTVVLSTVEKQFGIRSKEAAWIYSGNEFSQIFFVVFLPLVGKVKRRPLFMGMALALSTFGLLLMGLPHFTSNSAERSRLRALADTPDGQKVCDTSRPEDDTCSSNDEEDLSKDWTSLMVIFSGIFIYGIGGCFYYVFGLPYGDDNSSKEDGPMQFGIIWASRLLGPAMGFFLGGFCLRFYVNPLEEVDFDEDDPRWIGAWWLGFPIIAAFLLFFAPWFTLFPRRLKVEDTDAAKMAEAARDSRDDIKSPKEFVKETLKIYKRLLTIPIYMFNMGSLVFTFFAIIGFSQFLPKYLEFHYRQNASKTGVLSGVVKTISAVLGCLISSYLIGRYKIHARKLALWCALCGLLTALAFASFSFMSCPSLSIAGVDSDSGVFKSPTCSSDCVCGQPKFHPICSGDGKDLFSPCMAGCQAKDRVGNLTFYSSCSCVNKSSQDPFWAEPISDGRPLVTSSDLLNYDAKDGFCPVDCGGAFYAMLGVLFVVGFLGATTRTPNTLIMIRVINPKDKSASVSFILVCLSLLGFLPAPFVYGALMDYSCVLWDEHCGQSRNCLVYDSDLMRNLLNLFTAAVLLLAAACDFAVFLICKDLELYNQREQDEKIKSLEEKEKKIGYKNGGYSSNGGSVNTISSEML